jgi:hypothetical protein
MSCNTTTLGSGKTIDLCVNPKCENHPLSIMKIQYTQSPLFTTKEAELEFLKRDLMWLNLNLNHLKSRIETCQNRIKELES